MINSKSFVLSIQIPRKTAPLPLSYKKRPISQSKTIVYLE